MKIYFVRHQAGGVLWEFPFSPPPTAMQLAVIDAICSSRYGLKHPKTGDMYWLHVIDVDVLGAGDVPALPEARDDAAPKVARIGLPDDITLSGVASVQNPRE